jgi:hypothetical protein
MADKTLTGVFVAQPLSKQELNAISAIMADSKTRVFPHFPAVSV